MAGRYAFGHVESVMRSHEWRTIANSAAHLEKHLKPSNRVLDVGCGPGTITADFARVCTRGSVVGIDPAPDVIERARASFPAADHHNLSFTTASAYELPFERASFDVVHCHQTLHHLGDPVAALKEMRRVCCEGGIVSVRESDNKNVSWVPQNDALDDGTSLCARAVAESGGHPFVARHLVQYAREAGFKDITPSASTWCFSEPKDRQWWGGLWAARFREGPMVDQLRSSGISAERIRKAEEACDAWANGEYGWFTLSFGEIVCRA